MGNVFAWCQIHLALYFWAVLSPIATFAGLPLEAIMKDITDASSVLGKSATEFKSQLLDSTSTSALPHTYGVAIAADVDLKQLQLFAAKLKDEGSSYKAIFAFKMSHEEHQRRGNGMGMTNCVIGMVNTIREMKTEEAILRTILAKCRGSVYETIEIIDDLKEFDEKVKNKVKCLNEIGRLYERLGDHRTEIQKYNECISMMDLGITHPRQYQICGDCYNNKGLALYKLGHEQDALTCFDVALQCYRDAIDFSSEGFREEYIKVVQVQIKEVKAHSTRSCCVL